MRHRVDGRRLGRPTGHRLALYRNLVTSFLNYEKIVTTEDMSMGPKIKGENNDKKD